MQPWSEVSLRCKRGLLKRLRFPAGGRRAHAPDGVEEQIPSCDVGAPEACASTGTRKRFGAACSSFLSRLFTLRPESHTTSDHQTPEGGDFDTQHAKTKRTVWWTLSAILAPQPPIIRFPDRHFAGFARVCALSPGMRSIYLYKCHLFRWMERIPGETRQSDGLDTGLLGGYGCERSVELTRHR